MKTFFKHKIHRRRVTHTFLLYTALFINLLQSYGQTTVSGVIGASTNWTKVNSPYIVTANTLIMDNVVLTIEPGVQVRFDANVQLLLRGKLIAHGTATDNIWFMNNTGVSWWEGIKVDNGSYNPKVNLRFCRGTQANTLFNVVSSGSTDTLLKLTRCEFTNLGTVIYQSNAVKTHKIFIDSCFFSNIVNYVNAGASNNIILNSRFQGTYRAFYNSTSQNTIIDRCVFTGYSNSVLSVNGIITNCDFYGNSVAISTMGSNSPIIKYNHIHNNTTGIEAWNYGTSNSPTQINYNKICSNTYNVVKIYGSDTYVPNNCWCLSDSTQIQAKMYDFFAASNVGIIYFTPFDAICTDAGPTGVSANSPELSVLLTIFPNPFGNSFTIQSDADIKGFSLYNSLGQIIREEKSQSKEIEIAEEGLFPGIYFIKVETEKGTVTKKIIKQ